MPSATRKSARRAVVLRRYPLVFFKLILFEAFRRRRGSLAIEVRDRGLLDIVDEGAECVQALSGFIFTEGLAWHPYENHLTFSDIHGWTIWRWHDPLAGRRETLRKFRAPSHKSNGNTYDREGWLLTCEHLTSRVVRAEPDGGITVIASHFKGKELNSPNDIIVRSDGRIYFTDPMAGRRARSGSPRASELGFEGVFSVDLDGGSLTLLTDDFEMPNGLCFSVDETRLFINDTRRDHIRVFDIKDDGTLAGGEVWAEVIGAPGARPGRPDGMKVDSAGNLFCTGPGGVHVFGPDAACLGVIHTPETVGNFTWGGPDMKTLFIGACTSIYTARVKVPGIRLF